MKRGFSYSVLVLTGLFIVFLFCGVECNTNKTEDEPDDSDLCGESDAINVNWQVGNNTLKPADHYIGLEEGKAIYSYSVPTVFDVCTHKHLTGWMSVHVKKSYFGNVTFAAEILYRVVFIYYPGPWEYTGSDDVYEYMATIDCGMNDVFGDDPGHFFPIINISLPDQGSEADNNKYFEDAVKYVSIVIAYYEYQDNSREGD
jgi:hypothetical protein